MLGITAPGIKTTYHNLNEINENIVLYERNKMSDIGRLDGNRVSRIKRTNVLIKNMSI